MSRRYSSRRRRRNHDRFGIGILTPVPAGWKCRLADFYDGDRGSPSTGEDGATPADAIAAATEVLREHLAQHDIRKPRTAAEVAASGLAYDDETLVLIPITSPKPDPGFIGEQIKPPAAMTRKKRKPRKEGHHD